MKTRICRKIWKAVRYWIPLTTVLALMSLLQKTVFRGIYRREIWLVAEKPSEARDNGSVFFRWVRETHPEINCFYVIEKTGVDLESVKPLGNVIYRNSLKHLWYYLAAENSISSQMSGAYPYEVNSKYMKIIRRLKNPGQKCIFLQHGITYRAVNAGSLFYSSGVHDLIVTAAEAERDFFIQYYSYPPEKVANIGFCRFDRLKKQPYEKTVLLMPTWRTWLSNMEKETVGERETAQFESSEFFTKYSTLLKDPVLLDMLERYGYKLVFYPHYRLQPFIASFSPCGSKNVIIAGRSSYNVQELLLTSGLLVTDYSSVFFDFAYLKKPEIFFQFDVERHRSFHYGEGYFSYENDAFGPVCRSEDELLRQLEKYMRNCVPEQEYLERVDSFFTHRDEKNCERTYEAIRALHGADR